MDAELFWTIIAVAFVLGVGGLVGLVGFYWFVILPDRLLRDQHRGGSVRVTGTTPAPRGGRSSSVRAPLSRR